MANKHNSGHGHAGGHGSGHAAPAAGHSNAQQKKNDHQSSVVGMYASDVFWRTFQSGAERLMRPLAQMIVRGTGGAGGGHGAGSSVLTDLLGGAGSVAVGNAVAKFAEFLGAPPYVSVRFKELFEESAADLAQNIHEAKLDDKAPDYQNKVESIVVQHLEKNLGFVRVEKRGDVQIVHYDGCLTPGKHIRMPIEDAKKMLANKNIGEPGCCKDYANYELKKLESAKPAAPAPEKPDAFGGWLSLLHYNKEHCLKVTGTSIDPAEFEDAKSWMASKSVTLIDIANEHVNQAIEVVLIAKERNWKKRTLHLRSCVATSLKKKALAAVDHAEEKFEEACDAVTAAFKGDKAKHGHGHHEPKIDPVFNEPEKPAFEIVEVTALPKEREVFLACELQEGRKYKHVIFQLTAGTTTYKQRAGVTDQTSFYEFTGLKPNTEYKYVVTAVDEFGNETKHPETGEKSVKTNAGIAIVGDVLIAEVGVNDVIIEWHTTKNGDSTVEFGLDQNLGSLETLSLNNTTTHKVHVRGLTKHNETYFFRVISKDAHGTKAVSEIFSFKTTAPSDARIISAVIAKPVTKPAASTSASTNPPPAPPATRLERFLGWFKYYFGEN